MFNERKGFNDISVRLPEAENGFRSKIKQILSKF